MIWLIVLQTIPSDLQAENLKKKLPWLRYEQKKVQYQILKEKEKECKQRLIKAAEKINTLKRPVE